MNNPYTHNFPEWFTERKINEVIFCTKYIESHPMKCFNGMLYDVDGMVNPDREKAKIYEQVAPFLISDVDAKICKIYAAMKYAAGIDDLKIDTKNIYFNNGTFNIESGTLQKTKDICLNRLPVNYDASAKAPETWLKFLNVLLESDDILTLQEYMGYCLIPTTIAQKMLLIIGKGGEGKSRIGRVLRAILGDNMNTSSVAKLATDRFARADLEGKLLMNDDDMMMEALKETNILKTIVTNEDKTDLERKGKQSTQGVLYARLIGFSNGNIQSLYDKSDGFYRRQIILTTKDKPEDRVDDPLLGEKLISESEGIVLWCLEGLRRLILNNYQFTISDKAKENLEEAKKDDNNLIDFLESDGYLVFEKDGRATCRAIYDKYLEWCGDNLKKPFVEKTFVSGLKALSQKYDLKYMTRIKTLNDKYATGFRGIYPRV